MIKVKFETVIDCPIPAVYESMIGEETYKAWTAPFNPNCFYRGSWDKGQKILFIGVDKDGNEAGMVSRIKENIPNRFISIEHLGTLEGGKEIISGPGVDSWAGSHENYTFSEENGKTKVVVEMDTLEDYKSYFEKTWPQALEKLKSICEKN